MARILYYLLPIVFLAIVAEVRSTPESDDAMLRGGKDKAPKKKPDSEHDYLSYDKLESKHDYISSESYYVNYDSKKDYLSYNMRGEAVTDGKDENYSVGEELQNEELKSDYSGQYDQSSELREDILRGEETKEDRKKAEALREELLKVVLDRYEPADEQGKRGSELLQQLRNREKVGADELIRVDLELSDLAKKDDILKYVLEDSKGIKTEEELLKLREELLREEYSRIETRAKEERLRRLMGTKRGPDEYTRIPPKRFLSSGSQTVH